MAASADGGEADVEPAIMDQPAGPLLADCRNLHDIVWYGINAGQITATRYPTCGSSASALVL
jgi:hypothetical protein